MAEIIIDRDIPPPPPSKGGRPARFPFRHLQVGESFWSPTPTMNTKPWALKTGHKFTYRREPRNGIPGVRVWRIA